MSAEEQVNDMLAGLAAPFSPFVSDITGGRVDLIRYFYLRHGHEYPSSINAYQYAIDRAKAGSLYWKNFVETRFGLTISVDGKGRRDTIKMAGITKGFNAAEEPPKERHWTQKLITDRGFDERERRDMNPE